MDKIKVAIIGSGNIGTDLMIKIMRLSKTLEMGAFVGIDPESDGLKRAARMGVPITAEGIDGMIAMLEPGARLVNRTGLDDGSRRARITRGTDRLSPLLGWMKSAPRHYPDADRLRARFDTAGLRSAFSPLSGDTPFNNWLIVATRD